MKQFEGKVYTLADLEGNVFYVGATTQTLEKRFNCHLSSARSRVKYKTTYPAPKDEKIVALDFNVVATIVEIVTIETTSSNKAVRELAKYEKKWINHFLEQGEDLTNYNSVESQASKTADFVGKKIKSVNKGRIIKAA